MGREFTEDEIAELQDFWDNMAVAELESGTWDWVDPEIGVEVVK